MDLTGGTALVTGANRGIGRALVEELAQRPLSAVLAGVRDTATCRPFVGGRTTVRPVRLDLSSRQSIEQDWAAIEPEVAGLDLLVHNAGLMTGGLLEEQDLGEIYALFQVNVVAVAHLTQKVLPGMLERGRGKIVMNASIGGYAVFPAVSTYTASQLLVLDDRSASHAAIRDFLLAEQPERSQVWAQATRVDAAGLAASLARVSRQVPPLSVLDARARRRWLGHAVTHAAAGARG